MLRPPSQAPLGAPLESPTSGSTAPGWAAGLSRGLPAGLGGSRTPPLPTGTSWREPAHRAGLRVSTLLVWDFGGDGTGKTPQPAAGPGSLQHLGGQQGAGEAPGAAAPSWPRAGSAWRGRERVWSAACALQGGKQREKLIALPWESHRGGSKGAGHTSGGSGTPVQGDQGELPEVAPAEDGSPSRAVAPGRAVATESWGIPAGAQPRPRGLGWVVQSQPGQRQLPAVLVSPHCHPTAP